MTVLVVQLAMRWCAHIAANRSTNSCCGSIRTKSKLCPWLGFHCKWHFQVRLLFVVILSYLYLYINLLCRSRHSSPSKSHLDIGYVPPTDTGSLCLAIDSTRTAIPGLFRSLVQRSGTHCSQMNSEIRRVMSTASNSSLKQSCSAFTSATSALEVNF